MIIKELFEGPVGDYVIARTTIKCLFNIQSFMLQYVKASVWFTLVARFTPGAIFNNAP